MRVSTGSPGGFAVPFTLDATIMNSLAGAQSPIRQMCRTETVTTNEWRGVRAATSDATYRFIGGNSTEPLQMPSRDGAYLGRPKVEWSTMSATTTTGSRIVVAGDSGRAFGYQPRRHAGRARAHTVRCESPTNWAEGLVRGWVVRGPARSSQT